MLHGVAPANARHALKFPHLENDNTTDGAEQKRRGDPSRRWRLRVGYCRARVSGQ